MKERKPISSEIQQLLLVQCGYKCSVPRCDTTDSLEFHHINKKPNDNRKENVIILCAVHHHQADIGRISAKDCEFIKQTLPKIEKTTKKWDPIPKIKFSLAQRLLRTLIFPQVGWEAYNDSPYRLKVRIEVHPVLGERSYIPFLTTVLMEQNHSMWHPTIGSSVMDVFLFLRNVLQAKKS